MRIAKGCLLGLLPLLSTAILFVSAEFALRVYHWVTEGIPFVEGAVSSKNTGPFSIDERFGWRATENYRGVRTGTTAKGRPYPIHLSQNEFGFRKFGDVRSTKPKVFFIGDSYTHATDASDDRTYFTILGEELGLESFAYGLGGAGTLQEYLVLDRYFELVRPDALVWQFCSNDFVNNSPALESASKRNNNGLRRPYWLDESIEYILPKDHLASVRELAMTYSRVLAGVFHRIDKLQAARARHSVEDDIAREGLGHEGFRRAVQVTDEIMGKVRARVGAIPILAFNCDGGPPYDDTFREISIHHHIQYLESVGSSIAERVKKGEDLLAGDHAHWNEEGHRVVAGLLREALSRILARSSHSSSTDGLLEPR